MDVVVVQDAGWGVPVHGHGGGDALQQAGDCQPLQAQQGRPGNWSAISLPWLVSVVVLISLSLSTQNVIL